MTHQERSSLQFYVRYRDATPRFGDLLQLNVPLLLFWIVLVAGTLALAWWTHVPWAWLVPGMAIGAMLRDLRSVHATVKRWPWMRGIIDWHEVERRLAPPAPPP